MSHWQLGEREQARHWFDQAVQWINTNQPDDDEIRRVQAEAEKLMGITNQEE